MADRPWTEVCRLQIIHLSPSHIHRWYYVARPIVANLDCIPTQLGFQV